MKPETLTTNRLILRRANEQDIESLFYGYHSNVDSSKFLTRMPYFDVSQTSKFLTEWCDIPWDIESKKFAWVIALVSTNEGIGVFLVEQEDSFVQIHYGINPLHSNCGFITEAGNAVMPWLKCNNIKNIRAICDIENMASIRVLEKWCFKNERIINNKLILPAFGHFARDAFLYLK